MDGTDRKNSTPMAHGSSPRVLHSYTYFVCQGDFVKIGATSNPERRINGLQTGFPDPLEVLVVVHSNVISESQGHLRFAHLRASGEWFRAEPELLDFIETLKSEQAAHYERQKLITALRSKRHQMAEREQGIVSNVIEILKNMHTPADAKRLQPFLTHQMRLLPAA